MINFENSRTILKKWRTRYQTLDCFKPLRATTVTKPPDVHVANDDLSVSSQHSIEIHSPHIVICIPEMDNCLPFLLGRKLILLC